MFQHLPRTTLCLVAILCSLETTGSGADLPTFNDPGTAGPDFLVQITGSSTNCQPGANVEGILVPAPPYHPAMFPHLQLSR